MVDDFEKFISDFGEPIFDEIEDSFNVDKKWIDEKSLKVLFAHFPPSMSGIGGDCFPLFFSKVFPNATVHITYDKGRIVTPSEFIDMFRSLATTIKKPSNIAAVELIVIEIEILSRGISCNKIRISSIVEIGTPTFPTSPAERL